MSDVVIRVENLFKEYRLGVVNHGTLRHDLATWWANLRGKEDPNSLIGKAAHKDIDELKRHFLAVNDVSFEVKAGEVLGVIGRNGAGKSTLLKLLSRVTAPTAGEIKIKGRMASLLEVGTGFHPELTGRENVYMNGAILGMRRFEIARKMDEIVAFAELEKFIDTPVKRYSSGMYVRLAFAIAAHLDAEILVMDEVLAVGDATFQKKCLGKMDDVAKNQGRTVLFVSHNMGAVQELCTTGLFLSSGRAEAQGDIGQIIPRYLAAGHAQAGIALHKRTDREGSGLLRFEKIAFFDRAGAEVESVQTGDQLKIKLFYQKKPEIDVSRMIFGVTITDEFSRPVLKFLSDEMGARYANNAENTLTLEIPKLMLRASHYSVSLFATYKDTDKTSFCDLIEQAGSFIVTAKDIWESGRMPREDKMVLAEARFTSEQ